jgi:hypothetical protein
MTPSYPDSMALQNLGNRPINYKYSDMGPLNAAEIEVFFEKTGNNREEGMPGPRHPG